MEQPSVVGVPRQLTRLAAGGTTTTTMAAPSSEAAVENGQSLLFLVLDYIRGWIEEVAACFGLKSALPCWARSIKGRKEHQDRMAALTAEVARLTEEVERVRQERETSERNAVDVVQQLKHPHLLKQELEEFWASHERLRASQVRLEAGLRRQREVTIEVVALEEAVYTGVFSKVREKVLAALAAQRAGTAELEEQMKDEAELAKVEAEAEEERQRQAAERLVRAECEEPKAKQEVLAAAWRSFKAEWEKLRKKKDKAALMAPQATQRALKAEWEEARTMEDALAAERTKAVTEAEEQRKRQAVDEAAERARVEVERVRVVAEERAAQLLRELEAEEAAQQGRQKQKQEKRRKARDRQRQQRQQEEEERAKARAAAEEAKRRRKEEGMQQQQPGGGKGAEEGGAVGGMDLSDHLSCPISLALMTDPVVAEDGNTYQRQAIQDWIDRCRAGGREVTSPMSGLPMGRQLKDNHLVRCLALESQRKA